MNTDRFRVFCAIRGSSRVIRVFRGSVGRAGAAVRRKP